MPHFVSKNMFTDTNIHYNNFHIMDYLTNKRFPHLQLLPIRHDDSLFFIRCVQRQSDFLYKFDKFTKPDDLNIMKKILGFLSQKLDVINHNLHQTHTKHTRGMQSGFLLNGENLHTIQPDFIEIGFGSGRHILDLAKSNPNKTILGFEIHSPSIRQVINAIDLYNLKNLYICSFDARLALQVFAPNTVDIIFLHFPVPWNKAKHRRVFSEEFLNNSFRILKDSGYLHIRSDDLIYVQDSITTALNMGSAQFEVLKNKDAKIISKYEQRWSNMHKDIYELHIFKQPLKRKDYNNQYKDFIFEHTIKDLSAFCNQKWVYDSIFINIGDMYCSKKGSSNNFNIAQLAFGSFHMPFNTYLLMQENKISYAKKPLCIQSHYKAHEYLCKIFHDSTIQQN